MTCAAWPKAIHEGNGTVRVFIPGSQAVTGAAPSSDRDSYGCAEGGGCFKIFAAAFRSIKMATSLARAYR